MAEKVAGKTENFRVPLSTHTTLSSVHIGKYKLTSINASDEVGMSNYEGQIL